MYSPLVKAFNYALDRLSALDVPGLPKLRETSQIVFACSATKCIKSESYLQGSFKPDIVLVKWSTFKKAHRCADAAYAESYESDICHRSGCDQPSLSWRNVLSTLEVKHGGAGSTGNKPSKGKAEGKSAIHSEYTGDFEDFQDPGATAQSGSPPPPLLRMVREEYPTGSCKSTAPSSLPLLTKSSRDTYQSEKPGVFTLDYELGAHITEEAPNRVRIWRVDSEEAQEQYRHKT